MILDKIKKIHIEQLCLGTPHAGAYTGGGGLIIQAEL